MLGFLNQGEICTCPSRALVQESIYEPFMERVIERVKRIRQGDPFDTETTIGAQVSEQQYDKILGYLTIAREEGAQFLAGGAPGRLAGELAGGYYVEPTLVKGHNRMRVFQEEIFGPVIAVTTFRDEAEALAIANDSIFDLGAGCGRATRTAPIAWGAASRPAACGPTAITCIRRTRPSAATSNRGSGARPTR